MAPSYFWVQDGGRLVWLPPPLPPFVCCGDKHYRRVNIPTKESNETWLPDIVLPSSALQVLCHLCQIDNVTAVDRWNGSRVAWLSLLAPCPTSVTPCVDTQSWGHCSAVKGLRGPGTKVLPVTVFNHMVAVVFSPTCSWGSPPAGIA